ncbi:MAG TPA: GntR family transcriptional regulator [Acidimicrobiales bacterium]|jgi:DNA-binding FadR family transcriptional regulator|nr:GntR family transcriptional regulator [Acidimicrobiales bacterium]
MERLYRSMKGNRLEFSRSTERIRIPKVAEVVAQTLRRRIVIGEYQSGELLPPEGDLMAAFDVARTTIRDAFRVLESEGLLEVRRGGGGGGRVRAPGIGFVASYAGLLLQFEGATLDDVHVGRTYIEAPAVAILARRHDEPGLMETLRRALEEEAAADDEVSLSQAEGRFHRLVVDLTDNRVLSMLSAVANRLIGQQVERTQQSAPRRKESSDALAEAHRAHVHLVELIGRGDAVKAEEFWHRHLRSASEHLAHGPRAARTVLDLLP